MFSLVFCISTIIFLAIYLIAKILPEKKLTKSNFSADEITVIIPFRNEKNHLLSLIKSINDLNKLPTKFIFVDDHSEDNSGLLVEELESRVPYELLKLEVDQFGKKKAIRKALKQVNTAYFLTWDADIVIHTDYFSAIETIPQADLTIMPVVMKSSKWSHFFYELDYYFVNAISYQLSSFLKPIVASGANLLILRDKFLAVDSFENHQSVASGDDMFTLIDFKKNDFDIQINLLEELHVLTSTPNSVSSFIDQRIRWAKKTFHVKDNSANLIGILGFIIQFSFLISICMESSYFLFLVKIGFEMLLFFPYLKKLKRLQLLIFLPIFSLIYPIYLGAISGLITVLSPSWKGRKI